MNNRQRTMAILNYEKYDRMPVVHFGYWGELLQKWVEEGHISKEEQRGYWDGSPTDKAIAARLGFDFCWTSDIGASSGLNPGFEGKQLEVKPDGSVLVQNGSGLIELVKPGLVSIPATVGTLLEDRDAWEELYLPKLQPGAHRVNIEGAKKFAEIQDSITDHPVNMHVGSLYGSIRDMLGVEGVSYLYADDEDLYIEIINTMAEICYTNEKLLFEAGVRPDVMHYWEDICFKNGPLVSPAIFEEYVAPHYKRMTDLANSYGCKIVSLDCDGCIDKLVPIWLKNGVNTMFPIEVGTWEASLTPWREQYGKTLRGVGGMDKRVFAMDYAAIDKEIERLKAIIDLGGYIPCPDHRISPEAKWENIQYYCEQFRKAF